MIFVTTYRLKPFLSKEETAELLGVFAEVGDTPGATAHYVFADGGGGVVISESDDPAKGYEHMLNYAQWIQFDTNVMLPVEDTVPLVLARLS